MGGMEGRMSCRERNARRNQETFPCNLYIDVANASPWCMYVVVGESGKVENRGKSWKSLKEWFAVYVIVPKQSCNYALVCFGERCPRLADCWATSVLTSLWFYDCRTSHPFVAIACLFRG
jgi:hypothetical protein